MVSSQGVAPDPNKIQAMLDWPTPSSPSDLCGFLGLTSFYRKFICHYAAITTPLTVLLWKEQFSWSPSAQTAFDQLKLIMTQALVLATSDFTIPFTIESDASSTAMGTVLLQNSHPIAFFSKPLCPRLQWASTYVRELHAITSSIRKWHHYLLGHSFIILTDHRSLKELMWQVIQTPEQQLYLSKLLGYDYIIQYKYGSSNVIADALSQILDQSTSHLLLLSAPNFLFLDQL